MAVTFVAAGTVGAGTGAVTPGMPDGATTGDLLILVIEGEGEDASDDSPPTGGAWNTIGSLASATDGAVDRTRCSVYWAWYDAGINLSVPDAGNHTLAQVFAFRGVDGTTPIDATPTSGSEPTNTTSHTAATGYTTATDGAMAILGFSHGDDLLSIASVTNAALASVGVVTSETTQGSDGTIGIAYGIKTTAGAVGSFTWTTAATEENAWWAFALRPSAAPPPVTLTVQDAFHGLISDNVATTFSHPDPVINIGQMTVWWKSDDIPGTNDGDAVSSWTDVNGLHTLNAVISNPTLELYGSGKRAVKFSGTNALKIAEWAGIDFSATDEYTIIVQLGNSIDTTGTLVAKTESGSAPMHYQLQLNVEQTNGIGVNLHRGSGDTVNSNHFFNFTNGDAHSEGDVISLVVESGALAVTVYKNTSVATMGVTPAIGKGSYQGDEDFYVGARGNGGGTLGYQSTGSIRNVIVYRKALNSTEIGTVHSALTASAVTLVVQDAFHGLTSDNAALTHKYTLAPADAFHGLTSDQPTLTTSVTLVVQDAFHGLSSDTPTLAHKYSLVPADAFHGLTADQPTLTTSTTLVVQDAFHGLTSDSPTVSHKYQLAPADTAHGLSSEAPTLTHKYTLAPVDAFHEQTADQPTLSTSVTLIVQDTFHGLSSDTPAVTHKYSLVPAEAFHGLTSDQPTLTTSIILAVQDAFHGLSSDQPTLDSKYQLVVAETFHGLTSDQPTLESAYQLVVNDVFHGLTSGNVTLSFGTFLTVQKAFHGLTSDNAVLLSKYSLTVQDAFHALTSDQPNLVVGGVTLSVQDSFHNLYSDGLTLSHKYQLLVSKALHGLTSDQPTLTSPATLTVQDTFHELASGNVVLYRSGIGLVKVNVSGVWKGCPIKVYKEGQWVTTTVKYWNGVEWVIS